MIQASPSRALLPARVRINVPGVQLDDIQAILNMRDAWRFLMGSIDEPVSLEYLCKLNEFIARNEALEWGKLRTGRVAISGTDYTPPVPQEAAVRAELAAIAADTSGTEKALTAFCWGTRGQLFWDGNKRTSLRLANKILLQAGAGVLTIRDQNMEQFNEATCGVIRVAGYSVVWDCGPTPIFLLKSTKRSAAAIIRPQRSFITFHGALRNILLSAGFPAMFHLIALEQTFVNSPLQKNSLAVSESNRFDQ